MIPKVPLQLVCNNATSFRVTPDGGVLYIGSKTINYIGHQQQQTDSSVDLKVYNLRQNALALHIDPGWGTPGVDEKYFAVLTSDQAISIWDFERGHAVKAHRAHCNNDAPSDWPPLMRSSAVFSSFMCNRNLLSIDKWRVVSYCIASNTFFVHSSNLPTKNTHLTALSCSPFDENIYAYGTSNGMIVVCSLAKKSIIYKFCGHTQPVKSLIWNKFRNSIYKKKEKCTKSNVLENSSKNASTSHGVAAAASVNERSSSPKPDDDIFDIYDYEYLDHEFGSEIGIAMVNKKSTTSGADDVSSDSEFIGIEKPTISGANEMFDYVEACQSLRDDISASKEDRTPECFVTLADCQQVKRSGLTPTSSISSYGDDKENYPSSMENSLELVDDSSSSIHENIDSVGGNKRKNKKRILHKVDVHASSDMENPADATDGSNKSADAIDKGTKLKMATEVKKSTDTSPKNKTRKPIVFYESKKGNNNDQSNQQRQHNQQIEKQMLLASISIDGHIFIWNAKTGTEMLDIKMPLVKKSLQTCLQWLDESNLLITNKGQVKKYNLMYRKSTPDANVKSGYKLKEIKLPYETENVGVFDVNLNDGHLWNVTTDRRINCQNLENGKFIAKYDTLPNSISQIKECPHDNHKHALACPDHRLAILDISNISNINVSTRVFYTQLETQVRSIAWSDDSKKLAFSTIEGKVGVLNTEIYNPKPFIFRQFAGRPVYSLTWKDNQIFFVCNNTVAYYDGNCKSKDSIVVPELVNVSCLSIHTGNFFVGTENGFLEVYKRVKNHNVWIYQKMDSIKVASSYLSRISWNQQLPNIMAITAKANVVYIGGFQSHTYSLRIIRSIEIGRSVIVSIEWNYRNENELLVCSKDGIMRVWNINLQDNTCEETFMKAYHCPLLYGVFMPTDNNKLMIAGKTISIDFIDRREPNKTDTMVMNSPMDKIKWAVRIIPVESKNVKTQHRRKRRDEAVLEKFTNIIIKPTNTQGVEENKMEQANGVTASNDTLNVSGNASGNSVNVVEDNGAGAGAVDDAGAIAIADVCADADAGAGAIPDGETTITSEKLIEAKVVEAKVENLIANEIKTVPPTASSKETKTKPLKQDDKQVSKVPRGGVYMNTPITIFFLISAEVNKDALKKLKWFLSNDKKAGKTYLAKMFESKEFARQLINEEVQKHKESDAKGIHKILIPLWMNEFKQEVVRLIKKKKLTEWHVSVAPTISYQFWEKCALAYAEQLLERGYALQATVYYMALHKEREALDILLERKFHKEACLFAHATLEPDDPFLDEIVKIWMAHLDYTGNYNGAAYLSAVRGNMTEAFHLLNKTRNKDEEVYDCLKLLEDKQLSSLPSASSLSSTSADNDDQHSKDEIFSMQNVMKVLIGEVQSRNNAQLAYKQPDPYTEALVDKILCMDETTDRRLMFAGKKTYINDESQGMETLEINPKTKMGDIIVKAYSEIAKEAKIVDEQPENFEKKTATTSVEMEEPKKSAMNETEGNEILADKTATDDETASVNNFPMIDE